MQNSSFRSHMPSSEANAKQSWLFLVLMTFYRIFCRYLQGSTAMLLRAKPVATERILKRETTDSCDAEWVGLLGAQSLRYRDTYEICTNKPSTYNPCSYQSKLSHCPKFSAFGHRGLQPQDKPHIFSTASNGSNHSTEFKWLPS